MDCGTKGIGMTKKERVELSKRWEKWDAGHKLCIQGWLEFTAHEIDLERRRVRDRKRERDGAIWNFNDDVFNFGEINNKK